MEGWNPSGQSGVPKTEGSGVEGTKRKTGRGGLPPQPLPGVQRSLLLPRQSKEQTQWGPCLDPRARQAQGGPQRGVGGGDPTQDWSRVPSAALPPPPVELHEPGTERGAWSPGPYTPVLGVGCTLAPRETPLTSWLHWPSAPRGQGPMESLESSPSRGLEPSSSLQESLVKGVAGCLCPSQAPEPELPIPGWGGGTG